MPNFYEFFAGGGMARAGLGRNWKCLFANDFDPKKSAVYRNNWDDNVLKTADVGSLKAMDLPGKADLVWGSFPCQDLSLAGGGAGLKGERSGTFWPFWRLMEALKKDGRAPPIVVLENVCGTLTSHEGKDFSAICGALNFERYRFGAVVIDAALFIPQSRPRLFIIGIRSDFEIPSAIAASGPSEPWHSRGLLTAFGKLPADIKRNWIWWNLPTPPARKKKFVDIIEDNPESVSWHSPEETKKLLLMMSKLNREKVAKAKKSGKKIVGAIYKRTRFDENGEKVQRAEVRFDEIAGCLRTPAGGSSRQLILVVEGDRIKSRLISSRETARLMGLPDSYILPENYNEAYHLTGDGVVVPVVRHLTENIFDPILVYQKKYTHKAA
jgi:DNA (cytosine-5)-methyltransferase 1